MKKKIVQKLLIALLTTAVFATGITGCGKEKDTAEDREEKDEEEEEHKNKKDSKENENAAGKEEAEEQETAPSVDHTVYYQAYADAIDRIINDHVLPDGEAAAVDGVDYEIDKNSFAVYDVDEDGIKELIISWGNQCMAGMVENVYQYQPDEDTFVTELQEFPGVSYCNNGFAIAYWSHNQTYGNMWPYTIYEYNKDTNVYEMTGQVSAWDKEICDTGYNGEPFPDEVDVEHAGVVYDISFHERYTGGFQYSQSDYDDFYQKVLANKKPFEIPFHKINYEMAEMLRNGDLDPVITGKTVYPRLPAKDELDLSYLPDGIYQAKINPEGIYTFESEPSALIGIYLKETYDKVDMTTLQVGDGIEYNGEVREVKQVENKDYLICINGGLDQGGADFSPVEADDGYVYSGYNDLPTFREYGEAYLYMTGDCMVYDFSDIEVPGGNVMNIFAFPDYAISKNLTMNCYNTEIRVENGKVVEITIYYVP